MVSSHWESGEGRDLLNKLADWVVQGVIADAAMARSLGMTLSQFEEEFPFGVHRG